MNTPLKTYRAEVQVTQDFPLTIQAHSAEEAIEIAKCEVPYYLGDLPAYGSLDVEIVKLEPWGNN